MRDAIDWLGLKRVQEHAGQLAGGAPNVGHHELTASGELNAVRGVLRTGQSPFSSRKRLMTLLETAKENKAVLEIERDLRRLTQEIEQLIVGGF